MDLAFSDEERAFAAEVRQWLADHLEPPPPFSSVAEEVAWGRRWQAQLAEGRWVGIHWPRAYGGRGASPLEVAIFNTEYARARAPQPVNRVGINLTGPTLLAHGTEEQKARYLPAILSAEEIWCQLFSEPGAGSDLASLTTKATPVGGGWVLNGQKVWTSYAQFARWAICLARTDPDAPKHRGISYLIVDMTDPGIDIRPLVQITGEAPFNELFIDAARIPAANVVGGVGNGWTVALTTLMNERAGLAFFVQVRLRQMLDELFDEAAARGLLDDPLVADRLGALHVQCEVLRLTSYRGLAGLERHGQPGPEGSLAKLMWSQCSQQATQLAIDQLGPDTLTTDSHWSFELLRSRGNSIEGGTSEILKSIVAERVLGLPRGRNS